MKPILTIIPKLTIHPSKITLYNEYHWHPHKPVREKQPWEGKIYSSAESCIEEEQPKAPKKFLESKRSSQGYLSRNSVKKIGKSVEYLVLLSNPKSLTSLSTGRKVSKYVTFITLTLASKQVHSDNEIKEKCLNQFLIEIRRYHKVKNYVWKAEKQKNGNIHFHIVIDKYIDWWRIKQRWNRIQNKLNYVDEYRKNQLAWHNKGFQVRAELLPKWDKEKQYQAYKKGTKTNWSEPNSTDIHSIRKIINIKAYLSKYLTKNPAQLPEINLKELKNQLVEGRIWGCNYELSNIKGCQLCLDTELENEFKKIEDNLKPYIFESTYYSVINISLDGLKNIHNSILFKYFASYLLETFSFESQLSLTYE